MHFPLFQIFISLNIQHIKAEKDGEKAALFMRYTRAIRMAIQETNQPNPAFNSKLSSIISEALKKNMPMATINKNIEKFKSQQVQLRKHVIEAKCCNKIFLIAEFYTENIALLKSNINIVFKKEPKSQPANCKHMFDEIGMIEISLPDTTCKSSSELEDKITEDAIECEAQEVDDVNFDDKTATIICNPDDIDKVKGELLKRGYVIDNSEGLFIPHTTISITDDERKQYDSLIKRITQLEGFEKIFDNVVTE